MELANESLRSSRDSRREHAEEVAKLRGELEKERVSRTEAKAKFEAELAQAKLQQEETCKALEEERRLRKENFLSEKIAFEVALKDEKDLRVAAETRI